MPARQARLALEIDNLNEVLAEIAAIQQLRSASGPGTFEANPIQGHDFSFGIAGMEEIETHGDTREVGIERRYRRREADDGDQSKAGRRNQVFAHEVILAGLTACNPSKVTKKPA